MILGGNVMGTTQAVLLILAEMCETYLLNESEMVTDGKPSK